MVCDDLNGVFTAERAENAENKRIFVMSLRILPLRAPAGSQALWAGGWDLERSPAGRDASSGAELLSKQ